MRKVCDFKSIVDGREVARSMWKCGSKYAVSRDGSNPSVQDFKYPTQKDAFRAYVNADLLAAKCEGNPYNQFIDRTVGAVAVATC